MQSTSIIRRWIRGSLLITVLVLVLAEGLFLYYSYNDLYGGVERAVENRFSTVVGRLQATGTAGDTATTAESRANVLRRVVEQFDEKDKFEFMLLDAQGVILATSSGTMNRDLTNGTDYGRALTSANGIGSAIFTTPQGERVMAITMLVPYAAGSIAAMRMVTSLTLIDGQWWRTVAICVGLGVLVLTFTVWSGLFFVRSIVRPLGEVEATATKIAKGDMKVRLPDTRYDDEIGRLCKTINQMAEDLAETERLKNEFISSVSHEHAADLHPGMGRDDQQYRRPNERKLPPRPFNHRHRDGPPLYDGRGAARLLPPAERHQDELRGARLRRRGHRRRAVRGGPHPAGGDAARLLRAARAVSGLGRSRAAAAGVCESVR